MLPKLALAMAALAASSTAMKVPLELPNGVYAASFDTKVPQFTRLEKGEFILPEDHEAARRRHYMNGDDYEVAQACMIRFGVAGGFAAPNSVVYCKCNSAIMALCNYEGHTQPVVHSEISTFNGIIDNRCGSGYTTGWWLTPYNKTYWRHGSAAPVCCNNPGRQNC